jgi:hypothetical protein
LILFLAYMWGFQTAVYFKLRHEAKKTRILDYTPTQMQPVDPHPASGMALSHRGITLEVPCKDLNVDKSRVVGTWAIFAFDSGPIVTLCTPFKNDIRSAVEKEFGGPKAIEAVFGPEAVRSSMILLIKAISSTGGETGLYKVAANDFSLTILRKDPEESRWNCVTAMTDTSKSVWPFERIQRIRPPKPTSIASL